MKIDKTKMTIEEWREQRRKGIGSSDAAALLGLNPFKSPLIVYEDKINPILEREVETEKIPKVKAGIMMEPVIAEMFSKEMKLELIEDPYIRIHKKFNFIISNRLKYSFHFSTVFINL